MSQTTDLLREFCAENFTLVPRAIEAGARRIELCDNLAVGGTSPSMGVMEITVLYAHEHGADVMTMVRPRGGDFVYTEEELGIMEADIFAACEAGADGIVLGCLERAEDGSFTLDADALTRLVTVAESAADAFDMELEMTFHMAFDELSPSEQLLAIDTLSDLGFSRILTHGGPAGTPIEDNLGRLRELMDAAGDRLIILPGAGITHANAEAVAGALGAHEVHGTKVVEL